jgi:hypothetical protein
MTDPATYRKCVRSAVASRRGHRKMIDASYSNMPTFGLNWPRRLNAMQLAKLSHHQ